jgi:hypothetical protein
MLHASSSGIACLGQKTQLRAAGAGLAVISLDQLDVAALADRALRAQPDMETAANA